MRRLLPPALALLLLCTINSLTGGTLAYGCDRYEKTRFGLFDQCRWYRFDPSTRTMRFCMRLRRLTEGVNPVYVRPFLKSGSTIDTIKELEVQAVLLAPGKCATACWTFPYPDKLDLNRFYEYTDFEDATGGLLDFIWRTDLIAGAVSSAEPSSHVETYTWPLYNETTLLSGTPFLVSTSVDLGDALPGWRVLDMNPQPGHPWTISRGEKPLGSITIEQTRDSREGVSVIKPKLLDVLHGDVIHEVIMRFHVDRTPPEILDAGAEVIGDRLHFSLTAVDRQTTVADAARVHFSLNGGPFVPEYLEPFDPVPSTRDLMLPAPCLPLEQAIVLSAMIGPFRSGDSVSYYFTVPDRSGNTATTPGSTILLP
ncbi:MAG: hypothetical protein HY650_06560 [Acidobacteria bacterium]|nr:hypothetical protein [Acidobacteriota bacterium]